MKEKILFHIKQQGFYFDKFEPDTELLDAIFESNPPTIFVQEKVKKIIKSFGFPTEQLQFVYEDLTVAQNHALHTHLLPCDLQILIWGVRSEYLGRKFLYGRKDNIKEFTPGFGDICFMKANDLNFIHGVTPLKSETLIRTLVISVNYLGKYGEQVTVEAKNLELY